MAEHPFDSAAHEYDRIFTDPVPGRWFRDTVWGQVQTFFSPNHDVLDLGCGTGEDAVWMAGQDLHVTALDLSSEMLETAKQKAERTGLSKKILFQKGDLASLALDGVYDGALSNFGAVNCVFDLKTLAERLAPAIRRGGYVIFVVMGPYCPWEIIWYLLHGRVSQAFRRFRSSTEARVSENETIRIWYPSPRRFQKDFAPHFKKVKSVAVGTLVPPPYLDGLVKKGKPFFHTLWKVEQRLGTVFPFTWLNDHFLMVLKRV